jgi:hypothetical protein
MSLSYDGFKTRLTTEVPHLEKIGSFLRLIILEKDVSYFNFQIKGLLEKERNITIKAFAFASPGLHITNSSSLHQQNLKIDFVYLILHLLFGEMGFPF